MGLRIYGNRPLKTLPGLDTRPTLARVREAVFNIWQNQILDCRWLDLCSGCGSMGAEALCRGAKIAIAIEQSPQACRIINSNWQQVAANEQEFQIIRGNVVTKLKTLAGLQFDRIYFDPPYQSSLYQPVLDAITQYQLLGIDGEMAVEHHPKRWTIPSINGLEIYRQKVYGNSAVTFFRIENIANHSEAMTNNE
ncbi:MAG: 16S rRNA (guanine(966)-N(2))-methyltransferase RsmD [Microcoleaceae cyanobacterium]